jgi:SecD/SecF fusion protein
LRAGKGLSLAIQDGFSNAYSAIIDGNLTTIITGIVLFFFGTGPVKGFATTLVAGIITSLFCSIFITRVLLESRATRKGSISFSNKFTENFLQNVKFSFINKRKVSYILSGTLVVLSIISLFTLGLNKGIDFTGGRTYVVKFDQAANEDQLRENLEAQFSQLEDAANTSFEVKRFGGEDQLRVVTQFEPTAEMIAEAKAQVGDEADANYIVANYIYEASKDLYTEPIDRETFINPDNGKGITSSEQVGSAISSEMTLNSFIAVVISLVAIGLYIAVRFRRWQWALGATAALAHNALLVIGLFSMLYAVMPFNLEVNQAFIAAILTIIGYSINDTVVIFDRIREYIGLYPKRDMKTNIDNAICATLSRTINTSGTTLVTLLSIFIFGGETIRGFVFALILGVVIGTYSSVFIATPIAYDLQRKKAAKEAKDAE